MLPWQQRKKQFRKKVFWLELLCVSWAGHLLFLAMLFFVYRGSCYVFHVDVQRDKKMNVPIFFLPQTSQTIRPSILQSSKQPVVQKKTVPVPQPKRAMTTVHKTQKKPIEKKAQPKKVPVAKNTKKQIVPKEKKKEEIKKVSQSKNNKPKQVATMPQKKNMVNSTNQSKTHQPLSDISADQSGHVGGRVDLNALYVQEYIQKEVEQHWKPPVGLSKELACTIKIYIDWEGKATNAIIADSSSVLIYDIAARTAASALALPKWGWGKEFSIAFKQ